MRDDDSLDPRKNDLIPREEGAETLDDLFAESRDAGPGDPTSPGKNELIPSVHADLTREIEDLAAAACADEIPLADGLTLRKMASGRFSIEKGGAFVPLAEASDRLLEAVVERMR